MSVIAGIDFSGLAPQPLRHFDRHQSDGLRRKSSFVVTTGSGGSRDTDVADADRAQAKMQLAEHLGPEGRRRRTVGADEAVDHIRSRVLDEVVPERVEALDDLVDQRPGVCAVAGQPSPRVSVHSPIIEAGIPPMRSLGDGRRLLLWASIFRRLPR